MSAALFASMLFSPEAFAAIQCYQCHGTSAPADYRPLDAAQRNISSGGFVGSHRTHMGSNATPASCNACHVSSYLPSHRNDQIEMVSPINSYPGAAYSKGVFFNQTSLPIPGSCSNVNCHFERVTPAWGSAPFTSPNDCAQCHGAPPTGGAAGAAGSHAKHDTYYSGAANCAKCHADHTIEANPFIHATSAGKRNLNISFSTAPNNGSGTYNGALNDYLPSQTNTFGSCSATYCHSNGKKALGNFSTNKVATWGVSLPSNCTGCHKSDNASADIIATGSHSRHVNASKHYTMSCSKCHAATVNNAMAITDTNTHVNAKVNIKFNNSSSAINGTYGGQATPLAKEPGTAYGQCNNVYCHSNGQNEGGIGITYKQPTWGNPGSGFCGSCHGTSHHGGAEITTGSHTKHLASMPDNSPGQCVACHDVGGLPYAGSCNNSCHVASSKHTNNKVDLIFPSNFGATATYNGTPKPGDGYNTCSNVSCHYGTTTPAWGTATPINCLGCHTLAKMGGAHAKHVSALALPTMYNYTANRSTSTDYDFGCSNCHPLATTLHINGSINVTLKKDEAGVGSLRSKNSATGIGIGFVNSGITGTSKTNVVCSAAYCHSNGNAAGLVYAVTPNWYGGTFSNPDRCANCHGNAPNNGIAGSKAHYNNRFLGYTSNAGGHQIGIHAMKIYSSPAGLAHAGTASSSSHGNAGSSTTISCNICHYATITTARNDNNGVCKTCHVSGNTVGATFGNPIAIANKAKHINGTVDVAFQPVTILSKAQMRQSYFAIAAYSSAWKRNGGYKSNGGHDSAKAPLNIATMWDSSTKTCSNVACHNGQSVKWGDSDGVTSCVSCHTAM